MPAWVYSHASLNWQTGQQAVCYLHAIATCLLSCACRQSVLCPGHVCLSCAGHHVTTVPLTKGTEVLAFNPRYNKLLALAEPCVVSSRDRDNKVKEVTMCNVMLVQLK